MEDCLGIHNGESLLKTGHMHNEYWKDWPGVRSGWKLGAITPLYVVGTLVYQTPIGSGLIPRPAERGMEWCLVTSCFICLFICLLVCLFRLFACCSSAK